MRRIVSVSSVQRWRFKPRRRRRRMMKAVCQFLFRKSNYRGAAKPEVVLAELLCLTFSLVVRHVYVIIHSFHMARQNQYDEKTETNCTGVACRGLEAKLTHFLASVSRKSKYIAVLVDLILEAKL